MIREPLTQALVAIDAEMRRLVDARANVVRALDALGGGAVQPDAEVEALLDSGDEAWADEEIALTLDQFNDAIDRAAKKPLRLAPVKVNADNPYKVDGKWNWIAVGALAREAQESGASIAGTLRDRLDVSSATAQWMVKRCRELGHLNNNRAWTAEPMTRTAFDPDRARAMAAAAL